MAMKCTKLKRHALPESAVFYVSGGHHGSYGSTGHPYDILAVIDDAADVVFFSHRKGMNAAFKAQNFKDVIKLAGSSIWTTNPTEEHRRLTLIVLHAWISHANGKATSCSASLLTPQHGCGGISWLHATATRMEAGALGRDGTTPVGAGGSQIREANIHAISMWLLKEEAGPNQVEEQQCCLLSEEEHAEFQAIHFDCSRVCRGRCGSTDGLPKQPITMGQGADDDDCLCVFGGASRC